MARENEEIDQIFYEVVNRSRVSNSDSTLTNKDDVREGFMNCADSMDTFQLTTTCPVQQHDRSKSFV